MAQLEFNAQNKLLNYIKNFVKNSVDKVNADLRTVDHFENRLVLLEKYWENFFNNDISLIKYEDRADYKTNDHFANERFLEGENAYIQAKTALKNQRTAILRADESLQSDALAQQHRPTHSVTPPISHSIPKVEPPKFDGTQKEWDSWKEPFTAVVIDDKRIPDAIKLRLLLGCVNGPAKIALRGVSVTTSDFKVAWEKLLRTYGIAKHKLYIIWKISLICPL